LSILSYTVRSSGGVVTVEVTSSLSNPWYHWYRDGSWCQRTKRPVASWYLEAGDAARVECIDTTDAEFDPVTNAPVGWSARETLWWIRSLASDVDHYRVEQRKDGGTWAEVGSVPVVPHRWAYWFETPRLADLSEYEWRVTPVDGAGNAGTAIAVEARKMVRHPDAPRFAVTYNPGTSKVTFADAS